MSSFRKQQTLRKNGWILIVFVSIQISPTNLVPEFKKSKQYFILNGAVGLLLMQAKEY